MEETDLKREKEGERECRERFEAEGRDIGGKKQKGRPKGKTEDQR